MFFLQPHASGSDCHASRRVKVPKNHGKKGLNNIPYCIFFFSFLRIWSGTADSSSVWCRDCVWRFGNALEPVCVLVWKGEAVIILVCTEGRAVVELWHATLLHSLCSNENWNTPQVHEASQPASSRSQPLLCVITQQLCLFSLLHQACLILFTFVFVFLLKPVRRQRSHTPSHRIYTVAKYRRISLTLQCFV